MDVNDPENVLEALLISLSGLAVISPNFKIDLWEIYMVFIQD